MPTDVQASALIIGSNPWIDVTTGGGYNMFWTQTVSSPGAHVTYTSPGGMGTYSDGGYRNLLCVYN